MLGARRRPESGFRFGRGWAGARSRRSVWSRGRGFHSTRSCGGSRRPRFTRKRQETAVLSRRQADAASENSRGDPCRQRDSHPQPRASGLREEPRTVAGKPLLGPSVWLHPDSRTHTDSRTRTGSRMRTDSWTHGRTHRHRRTHRHALGLTDTQGLTDARADSQTRTPRRAWTLGRARTHRHTHGLTDTRTDSQTHMAAQTHTETHGCARTHGHARTKGRTRTHGHKHGLTDTRTDAKTCTDAQTHGLMDTRTRSRMRADARTRADAQTLAEPAPRSTRPLLPVLLAEPPAPRLARGSLASAPPPARSRRAGAARAPRSPPPRPRGSPESLRRIPPGFLARTCKPNAQPLDDSTHNGRGWDGARTTRFERLLREPRREHRRLEVRRARLLNPLGSPSSTCSSTGSPVGGGGPGPRVLTRTCWGAWPGCARGRAQPREPPPSRAGLCGDNRLLPVGTSAGLEASSRATKTKNKNK